MWVSQDNVGLFSVCKVILSHVKLGWFRVIRGYSGLCGLFRVIQGYSGLFRVMQGYAGLCRVIQS